jgi:hypothetical protein
MVVEGSERLDTLRTAGQARADSAYAALEREIAELRELLRQHEREIARLKAERESVCCTWWAQSWHRPH